MPHFASDIWSTMCVLVEMLTAKSPWDNDRIKHHTSAAGIGILFMVRPGKYIQPDQPTASEFPVVLEVLLEAKWKFWVKVCMWALSLFLQIGNYTDDQMETALIPDAELLDSEVIELMRLVFRKETSDRATAMELLEHPLIANGEGGD